MTSSAHQAERAVPAGIILARAEIEALTGYKIATKQLNVLHARGFTRAYINRLGELVLERAHYEVVCRGELHTATGAKVADLGFMRGAK